MMMSVILYVTNVDMKELFRTHITMLAIATVTSVVISARYLTTYIPTLAIQDAIFVIILE